MVVGADHIAQRTQPLLHSLNFHRVGEGVAEMLDFLVCSGGGDEEAGFVACGETPDDAGAGDGAGDEGDEVAEFGFEDGVECRGGVEGDEAVGVCEGAEDAYFVGVLEL